MATNRAHKSVTKRGGHMTNAGEHTMRAQRAWKKFTPARENAEIEGLRLELAAFNERIEQLEKQHPCASKIEELKASALALARQIDELRCSNGNDLTDLLAR